MRRIVVLAALLFAILVAPAKATTWYVISSYGNDTNDGKSLGTAFATISHALLAGVAAGDTINCAGVFGGGTSSTEPVVINITGTAGNPITLQGYYQGLAGPPCMINGAQNAYNTVHITPTGTTNVAYININNLEVAGWNGDLTLAGAWTNASGTGWASAQYSGGGIVVDINGGSNPTNQTATGTNNAGQATINLSTNPITGNVFVGDTVYDTTHPASTPTGSAIVLSRTASTIVLTTNLVGSITSGDTLQVRHLSHHINITNNYVHDFPEDGISAQSSDYITITGNIVSGNALYSPFAGAGISVFTARDVDTTTGYKINVTGNLGAGNIELIGNHFGGATVATNGTTAVGNSTLHFASTSAISNGMQVMDTATGNSGAIPTGTTVVSGGGGGTTLTISNPVATGSGSGVGNGDSMLFTIISDGEAIIIDDNNGDQAGEPAYGGKTLVSNNVGINSGNSCIVDFDSHNVDITFNTCYLNQTNQNGNSEINNLDAVGGNIYNNILQAGASNPVLTDHQTSGQTLSNNLGFGGNGTTMAGSNNISGQDPKFVAPTNVLPSTLTLNPLTWTAFALQPSSPAIDAASSSFTRTTDFLGNPGLAGPSYDIGAYESPCSPYTGNTISNMTNALNTLLADGQSVGAITPSKVRQAINTVWCGRSPYSH